MTSTVKGSQCSLCTMNAVAHFFDVYILLYKDIFVKHLYYEICNKANIIFVVLDEYHNKVLQDFCFKNSKQTNLSDHSCGAFYYI